MRRSLPLIFLSIIAVALAGLAVSGCGTGGSNNATAAAGHPVKATLAAEHVTILAKSDTEHARKGADGKWHDAFLPASIVAKAGQRVTVTLSNYDDAPHTFTAPGLGVNVKVPGGSAGKPASVTFSFTAPKKPGVYEWFCAMPCDPAAMGQDGYMRGHVTVTA